MLCAAVKKLKLSTGIKALHELGARTIGLYSLYQLGLRTGFYRLLTPANQPFQAAVDQSRNEPDLPNYVFKEPIFHLPDKAEVKRLIGESGLAAALAEADEVVVGQVRLFGSEPVPLQLELPAPLQHWSVYERKHGMQSVGDVKFVWEGGRFGWAYTLGRAYLLSGDERYTRAFWDYAIKFLEANPPNLGLHWFSAQEVALRLIALAFGLHVFRNSPSTTGGRSTRLMRAIAEHAARIPPTLVYARSLNNNHLISEAVGLLTAATLLPEHPPSRKWESLGWSWFIRGLREQIDEDGAYTQNSTNYHRLVLQLALWMNLLIRGKGRTLPQDITPKLAQSTRWLLSLVDVSTGKVPNLGSNDGAYLFPLTACPFDDFRPVLQAAGMVFLGERPFPPGPWDEMAQWFQAGGASESGRIFPAKEQPPAYASPHILRGKESLAYVRVAKFFSRPGHADLLHLDLWWRGLNVAHDAGTYLYNTPPPWDNSLSKTDVHNTLTVNGCDQMTRAGRFLWLDWAKVWVISYEKCGPEDCKGVHKDRVVACHDGFQRLGVLHQRTVTCQGDRWIVEDSIIEDKARQARVQAQISVRLHWLLLDWPWEIDEESDRGVIVLNLLSPHGWMSLRMATRPGEGGSLHPADIQLTRAGERLYGTGEVRPTWGWASPTYGVKIPALSFSVSVTGHTPLALVSEFDFP